MGRNYIAERTIADPRERAADKVRRKAAKARKAALESASIAAYIERNKYCMTGCGQLRKSGENGWWPCCSESCHKLYVKALEKKTIR